MLNRALLILGLLVVNQSLLSADQALTVYSSADASSFDPQQYLSQANANNQNAYQSAVPGFGVVRSVKEQKVTAGIGLLKLEDVASFIDPTTVSIKDLNDPSTSVLEQNFQFDLINTTKLMERYLDRDIVVRRYLDSGVEELKGKLLSADGQIVLQTSSGIRIVPAGADIQLGELPGGLITKPALLWKINSRSAGTHQFETTYQTNGLTWRADYNLILNKDDTAAALSAWVSLLNLSGASYVDTRLKLIAGDVQRVAPQPQVFRKSMVMEMQAADTGAAGFEEKSFFEYHMYTLPGRTDLLSNQTKQITLFPAVAELPVEKVLVYYGNTNNYAIYGEPSLDRNLGTQSNTKIDIYIRFENKKGGQLGVPLPKGKLRVYKQDSADGGIEFIGEDVIDHTPRDEDVLVKIGQSFDIVGSREQTNFSVDSRGRKLSETYSIKLKNHKDHAEKVIIRESLFRWTNWKITDSSSPFEKKNSRIIEFPVSVPANGEQVVNYTVDYSW